MKIWLEYGTTPDVLLLADHEGYVVSNYANAPQVQSQPRYIIGAQFGTTHPGGNLLQYFSFDVSREFSNSFSVASFMHFHAASLPQTASYHYQHDAATPEWVMDDADVSCTRITWRGVSVTASYRITGGQVYVAF